MLRRLLALWIVVLLPVTALAQVPLVPVQGYLSTASGGAVSSAGLVFDFRIYDAAVGGSELHAETGAMVDVINGIFTFHLGSTDPLDMEIFDGRRLFLEVQLDGELPMTPRMEFATTPYAAYAAYAASAPWAGLTGVPAALADGDDDTTYNAASPIALTGTTFGLSSAGCDLGEGWIMTGTGWSCEPAAGTAYTAGPGLQLTDTTFAIDSAQTQVRVTGSCPAGEYIRSITSAGSVVCQADISGTAYSAGTGLALDEGQFAINPLQTQARVTGTCLSNQYIRAINTDGTVVCQADGGQTLSAGTGLQIAGSVISIRPTEGQIRVGGTCPLGESIRVINSDGSVLCEPDTDTNTTYTAGTGLTLNGTQFVVNSGVTQLRVTGACSGSGGADFIRSINANGTVTCGTDANTDTNTTYTAGPGLTLTGTEFSVNTAVTQARVSGTCGTGTFMSAITSTGAVTCTPDTNSGGTITGVTAGTGLSGGGTSGTVSLAVNTALIQTRVGGTCAAGSSIRTITVDGTVVCEADNDREILNEMLERGSMSMTGGGVISRPAADRLKWTHRIIMIGGLNDANNGSNYQNIEMPAPGAVITGMYGHPGATVDANGVPMGTWDALYYYMPRGSTAGSAPGSFRLTAYSTIDGAASLLPAEYVLIAVRNADGYSGQIMVNTDGGIALRTGQVYDSSRGMQPLIAATCPAGQEVYSIDQNGGMACRAAPQTTTGTELIYVNGAYSRTETYNLERFHMIVNSSQYRKTTLIPQAIIDSYCGDVEGCTVHVGMDNWSGTQPPASGALFQFFYDTSNRQWRASWPYDSSGVDGSGGTQHVMQASDWDSCYFTDGVYNVNNTGDPGVGMSILYWTGYGTGKTCFITIID